MRKLVLCALVVAFAAGSAAAATWHAIGTSGFTTNPLWNQDYNRIRLNCISFDGTGNIYMSACNGNNDGANAGGYTIFKTNGTKIDVNLTGLGLFGAITNMVQAGDGMVYALQNWLEINWGYPVPMGGPYIPSRILRLDPNGSVTVIAEYAPVTLDGSNWNNRITGMAVGGDGNVYWIMSGNSNYWKYHFLWRYDVASGTMEEAPINNVNNGWSEADRLLNFEYTGSNWFHVIDCGGNPWRADPINWTTSRVTGIVSDPGWGRNWCTGTVFDPIKNKLWIGARGAGNRCILSRWNGDGTGLFQSHNVWHALDTDMDMGVGWWTSAIACHPTTGDAWMAFTPGNPTNTLNGWRGHVIRRDENLVMYDEGVIETDDLGLASNVAALAFDAAGNAYATVLNNSTGVYTLYTTAAGDLIAPSVEISSPTSGTTYLTNSPTLTLAGTASDNVGVSSVTWSNDRGGSGTCSGTTSWSASGIALFPGANVITVTAHDAAGNTGTDTITVTLDNTPPSVTVNQAAGQLDPTHGATINFTIVFSESVTGFTASDVVVSGTAGGTKTVNVTGSGTTYTASVSGAATTGTVIATIPAGSAQDAAGNGNAASTSTDNTVTYVAGGTTVAAAKQLGNNAGPVGLVIKLVSAVFSDHFYVQDASGMGIKIVPAVMPAGIAIGKKVDVAGIIKTDSNGERYIDGTASVQAGSGSIRPYGMCNRSQGGVDWLFNPTTGAGQRGVTGGFGANNIGLLVTTTGRVVSSGGGVFAIDDGSGVGVKCVAPTGVTLPAVDAYVSVTGISSLEFSVGGYSRVLKVRTQADIR